MKSHRKVLFVVLLLVAWFPAAGNAGADPVIDQDLVVRIDPAQHRLEVRSTVTLAESYAGKEIRFVLHAGLDPVAETPGIEIIHEPGTPDPAMFGYTTNSSPFTDDISLAVYLVRSLDGKQAPLSFGMSYVGAIHHPVEKKGEEYARSFSETPGTIQSEGVFLAGSTFWYPRFGRHLYTYELEVETPSGWDALSGGSRAVHEKTPDRSFVRWESPEPLDDIYLVAAPFTVYEDTAGKIATYAYLRTPDEPLARKYLDTTAQYLEMYGKLLGPYPYSKFALVENFWDTGYGMPSFTLLGSRVIRFPFILHSSYPHEILHNWWGNGVFVDYQAGNWCEGLTAYLADHLIKEQRGQGAAYRRDLLQKYSDYVRDGLDFPLTEFRSRHSSATQAVGYGKAAMLFHMLRLKLGDEIFVNGLRTLYGDQQFHAASWTDVRKAFETASGAELVDFFHAWVDRAGAPVITIKEARTEMNGADHELVLQIAQVQDEDPVPLQVPVAVTLEGLDDARMAVVEMSGRTGTLRLKTGNRPVRVQVDPRFDLFRKVHRAEIPASLGQVFGAEKVLVVLSSSDEAVPATSYRELAESWTGSQAGDIDVVMDTELESLPGDHSIWLFGWNNRFRKVVADGLLSLGASLTASGIDAGGRQLDREDSSVVAVIGHPDNPDLAVAFLGAENRAAHPGLGRKLPHYGKYGYLGFQGDEPTNIHKGQWEPVGSPLDVVPEGADPGGPLPAAGKIETAGALANLPPLFSRKTIEEHVSFIADTSLEGRGCGSEGLARAAGYIEEKFREIGLAPGWENGYRHPFTGRCGDEEKPARMVNIAGVIPGAREDWQGQSVVVIAHYDHLGFGWPQDRESDRGKIHPGADDNASGVAVMLELARILNGSLKPDRDVVFLAVAGEEAGLQGARAYVRDAVDRPAKAVIGALNIDTIGRLGDGKVLVIGAGSAGEWVHIVRGAGYVTGVPAAAVMDDLGSSDHKAFLDAGIPAVQFFTGPHLDYHRPTDTADKLDGAGMVRTATFVKEFVEYLAGREEPLSSKLGKAEGHPGGASTHRPGGRRVSLGTIPDFEFQGPGVRIGGLTPGSPAEQAGLLEGDVVVRIDDDPIEGLRDLSNVLKKHVPGDVVIVAYIRDGEEKSVRVELKQR